MGANGKVRRVLATMVKVARAVRDGFPLTAKGVLLAAGSALALWRYGLKQVDLLLLVVGAVGLSLAAISLLVVGPAALGIALGLRKPKEGEPVILTTGIATRTGFTVRNFWFVPLLTVE